MRHNHIEEQHEIDEGSIKPQRHVTMMKYYAYQLQVGRHGNESLSFWTSLQQYIVDAHMQMWNKIA
jgi:hypothetical protein